MRSLALLVALFALGCAPPGTLPRAPDPRARDALVARAGAELGCARASWVELAPGHVAVVGCDAQREYRRTCSGGSCDWIAIDDLAIRAGFELDCETSAIEIVTLGASSRGVIGCGARVTYVLVCSSDGCHWLPSSMRRDPGTHAARKGGPAGEYRVR